MDEDDYAEGDGAYGNAALEVGDGVLIETSEGLEAGVLTLFAGIGVFFRSTHKRIDVRGATDQEKEILYEQVGMLNRRELVRFARESGEKAWLGMNVTRLRGICRRIAVADYVETLPPVRYGLATRAKDVLMFIPGDSILRITHTGDLADDASLNEMASELSLVEAPGQMFPTLVDTKVDTNSE